MGVKLARTRTEGCASALRPVERQPGWRWGRGGALAPEGSGCLPQLRDSMFSLPSCPSAHPVLQWGVPVPSSAPGPVSSLAAWGTASSHPAGASGSAALTRRDAEAQRGPERPGALLQAAQRVEALPRARPSLASPVSPGRVAASAPPRGSAPLYTREGRHGPCGPCVSPQEGLGARMVTGVLRRAGWASGDLLPSQTLSAVAQGTWSLQGSGHPPHLGVTSFEKEGGGWLEECRPGSWCASPAVVSLLRARGTELPGLGPFSPLGVGGDGRDLLGLGGPTGAEAS